MMTSDSIMSVFGVDPWAAARKIDLLTNRERQVLERMVRGEKNSEIAAVLGISPKTLDIHRANIVRKTETRPNGLGRLYFAARFESLAAPSPEMATPG